MYGILVCMFEMKVYQSNVIVKACAATLFECMQKSEVNETNKIKNLRQIENVWRD